MESKYKDISYYNDEVFLKVFPKMLEEDAFKKLLYYAFDGFAETHLFKNIAKFENRRSFWNGRALYQTSS